MTPKCYMTGTLIVSLPDAKGYLVHLCESDELGMCKQAWLDWTERFAPLSVKSVQSFTFLAGEGLQHHPTLNPLMPPQMCA